MKAFLVHVHIYYTEMWPELRAKLLNISPYSHELFVTLVEENEKLQNEILEFNPKANIEILENRGFDIGPFVHVINKLNLDDYSYVIKLHTKRSLNDKRAYINNFSMNGTAWKDYLFEFISTKDNFSRSLNALEKNKKVAMLGHYKIILKPTHDSKKFQKIMKDAFQEFHLDNIPYKYVAGTMFIAKADIFKRLQNLEIELSDFEFANKEIRDGQLAHKVERFLGLIVYLQECEIADLSRANYLQNLSIFWAKFKAFLYLNTITNSGKHIIKICKIPVWNKKI